MAPQRLLASPDDPFRLAPSYSRADSARSRPESEGGALQEFYFDLPSRGARPSDSASPRTSACGASVATAAPSWSRTACDEGASSAARPEHLARLPLPTIPESLLCPISREVMRDPVTAADGITYERECLASWLRAGHRKSPVTEAELASLELVANEVLRDAIGEYLMLRDLVQSQQREWEGLAALREFRTTQRLAHKRQQVRDLKAALELSERKGQILRNAKGSTSGASTTISTGVTTPHSRSIPSSAASPRNAAAADQATRMSGAAAHPEESREEQEAAFRAGKAPRHPAPPAQAPRRRQACPLPVLLGS